MIFFLFYFSGKSTFILKLLKHRKQMFSTAFSRIVYCVPGNSLEAHQNFITQLKEVCPTVEVSIDLPKSSELKSDLLHKLFILDDLFHLISSSQLMTEAFLMTSHHYNSSLIFTTQNFFHQARDKSVVRNCSYKAIFNDKSDQTLIRNISSQISHPQFLASCFKSIESLFPEENYPYILIDSDKKSLLKKCPIRSRIFPMDPDNEVRPLCFFPD